MGRTASEAVGVIYGQVEATEFNFAASDPTVKRLDYVSADHPNGLVLCQVSDVQRKSQLSFEEAVALHHEGPIVSGDHVTCHARALGYRDERGLLQLPRTPFRAGTEVRRASPDLIRKVLGITVEVDHGAYLGFLKGSDLPVVLDVDTMVQKHVSILAKTGAGKSYTVGVLIEEFLSKRVPLVIIDPHGEYGTLANPNVEPKEIDNLIRFRLKPRSFAAQMTEYALEARAGTRRLELEGSNLEAREIMDLLGARLSSAQQGLLYQAVNELKKAKPLYHLRDLVEELSKTPSNAKWPVISALENLESTKLFSPAGTGVGELVRPGQASILNLKGASPEIQEVAVARLARLLFESRKKNLVPPFMFVVEEAHNFCPERSIASALSGMELRTVASEGRKFGMGLLIVSQRPAKVDKNVLSQCNTQIIMKVTNPNDLKAITASVEGLTADTADEIQRLGVGVALVAGGNLPTPLLVEVRTRQTRHGGKSVSVLVDEEDEDEAASAAAALPARPSEPVRVPATAVPVTETPYAHVVPAEEREASEHVAFTPKGSPHLVAHVPPWASDAPRLPEPPPSPSLPERAPSPPPVEERRPKKVPAPVPEISGGPEARLEPSGEPNELALFRVVTRVGYGVRTPREAVAKLRELARDVPALTPDDYLRAYARIGHTYCFPARPECGPCPLLRTCRLGSERLQRGEVRSGRWGTRR